MKEFFLELYRRQTAEINFLLILGATIIGAIVIGVIITMIIDLRTKEIRRTPVDGVVFRTQYYEEEREYTTPDCCRVIHPAEYILVVYYQYAEGKGLEHKFNSEKYFKQYKEDDTIPLIFVEHLDKNNKVIHRALELPE